MDKNKKIIIGILIAVFIVIIVFVIYKVIEKSVTDRADHNFTVQNISSVPVDTVNNTNSINNLDNERSENMKINVIVNGKTLKATLYDNATTRDLILKLPLTIDMADLYDREMCYRFSEELEHDNIQNRRYEVGEIIYWNPGHSLVFMYKQNGEKFAMQSVGKFDEDISIFETTGDTKVTIELAK